MASSADKEWTNGSGTFVAFNYTDDFDKLATNINNLKVAVNDLTSAINNAVGSASATIDGSLGNSTQDAARMLKAAAIYHENTSGKLAEFLTAFTSLAKQLSGISGTIAAGVATAQIGVADQIKKNAFDKAATQAALARNKIPEVTVTNTDFLTTMSGSVTDAASIAAQAAATGFVVSTAQRAVGSASDYVTGLLPSLGDITQGIKNFAKGKTADQPTQTTKTQIQTLIDATTTTP